MLPETGEKKAPKDAMKMIKRFCLFPITVQTSSVGSVAETDCSLVRPIIAVGLVGRVKCLRGLIVI